MIVCHCNVITRDDIKEAVRSLLDRDPWAYVTPNAVYEELGKRGKCFGCYSVAIDLVIDLIEAERHSQDITPKWVDPTLTHLRLLKDRRTSVEALKRARGPQNERRSQSHRTA